MRKVFILSLAFTISLTMLFFSCNREEPNSNGNNTGDDPEEPLFDHIMPDAVTDIDGNIYDAVRLGNQVWMAENLRTTRYADGTEIPLSQYGSSSSPIRHVPGNGQSDAEIEINVARYGYLYNWPAVMNGEEPSSAVPSGVQGICPTGWHVPSETEWTELVTYLTNQSQYQCDSSVNNVAKSLASTTDWETTSKHCAIGNNLAANNSTGFSALPAGGYFFGTPMEWWFTGNQKFGIMPYFRHASSPNTFVLDTYEATVRSTYHEAYEGFSVRCVRD